MIPQYQNDSKQNKLNSNNDLQNLLFNFLKKLQYGSIQVTTPDNNVFTFKGSNSGPWAQIKVNDPRFYDVLFTKGDIGLGETYIKGYWDSPNLSDLIQFGVFNKDILKSAIYGQSHKLVYYKIKQLFKRNTIRGSKKNIQFHYDLGNNFYQLWLDSTMTYSSAYWGSQKDLTLDQAQIKKYEFIFNQLQAVPGQHILEIGCGWGGFAEYAAERGIRVTGLTLSKEQKKFAEQRLASKNLSALVDIQLVDYRHHTGQYDHIVSIEMIEAVGEAYWSTYFDKIKSLVKPEGRVCIQSIVIDEKSFSSYRKGTDFIQQYIFPGGMLPTVKVLEQIVVQKSGVNLNFHRFGLDYARTLKIWDEQFLNNVAAVQAIGFGNEFIRMWHFYLGYYEGAFRSLQTDVVILSYRF